MGETQSIGSNPPVDEARRASGPKEARPRAVGSPLPTGADSQAAQPSSNDDPQRPFGVPPPGRALSINFAPDPSDGPSAIARALGALRSALPYVQKILPLLDGNIGTAVSNMLTPHHHPAPPPPPVNLASIEDGLMDLQTQHKELRDQVVEQNSSLKRVEDQLEMVREATDRNTLEQQELLDDLKGVGNKVNVFALIALGLLAVSVLINIVLYLHILKVLP
ncbi:MAG: hypothetical protein ACLPY1_17765 [Terracidiphilus sp.]